MNILALDTTTNTSSIAVHGDAGLIAEYNFAHKKDLSRRLMKNIEYILKDAGLAMADLGGIGVSLGPGSFTGLRIGIVTAKSLAQALNIPIAGISALDLLAHQFSHMKGNIICPLIRVRKGEAYYALFRAEGGELTRTSDYLSGPIADVVESVKEAGKDVIFCGDALTENIPTLKDVLGESAIFAPEYMSFPKAAHMGKVAMEMLLSGNGTNPLTLAPMYLRKSTPEIRLESNK